MSSSNFGGMSLPTFKVSVKVNEAEKHSSDITCLLYYHDKLYSGANDGKIKVRTIFVVKTLKRVYKRK